MVTIETIVAEVATVTELAWGFTIRSHVKWLLLLPDFKEIGMCWQIILHLRVSDFIQIRSAVMELLQTYLQLLWKAPEKE